MSEKFEMVAKTFQGLEAVLAKELRELGADDVEEGRRMVSFKGDKKILYKANFCCRTALRILKPFFTFSASDADTLYEEVRNGVEWDTLLTPEQTFSIDSTVFSEEFRHSKFVTYKVKDAIADFFTEKYGKRPSIRLQKPDVVFNVHIAGTQVTISLDSSGESLHKRGYRVAQTDAPINEVLAAGLLLLAGWEGNRDLVDPMCGSGTFLIEAAMIATNTYPGIYRSEFAFERWNDFDSELLESLYNDDTHDRDFRHHIYGSDISPKAIDIANRNIRNAGMSKYITTKVQALQNIEEAPAGGMLISNPPYGERLALEDVEKFYRTIGNQLKNVFRGYDAWLIGPRTEIFDLIGLKPSLHYPVLNGSIECELREYVIFEGTYSEFRKSGRDVKNEEFKERRADKRIAKPAHASYPFKKDAATLRDKKPSYRKPNDAQRSGESGDAFDKRKKLFGTPKSADTVRDKRDDKPKSKYSRPERPARPEHVRRHWRDGEGEESRREKEKMKISFREPSLGVEAEVPIIKGRRNSWKRKDEIPGAPAAEVAVTNNDD